MPLPDALVGRRFTVVEISGREVVPGRPVFIYFNDSANAAIQTGCNGINAVWAISECALVLSDIAQGTMNCPDPANAREQFITTFLSSSPAVMLTGDEMTLSGADGTVVRLAG